MSPERATDPFEGVVTATTVRASPFGSESLSRTSIAIGVAFGVDTRSSIATGSWPATTTVTVDVAVAVPSVIVTAKVSVPSNPAFGT